MQLKVGDGQRRKGGNVHNAIHYAKPVSRPLMFVILFPGGAEKALRTSFLFALYRKLLNRLIFFRHAALILKREA